MFLRRQEEATNNSKKDSSSRPSVPSRLAGGGMLEVTCQKPDSCTSNSASALAQPDPVCPGGNAKSRAVRTLGPRGSQARG